MRLKDKVAIITGAGRGIGKTVALAFATERSGYCGRGSGLVLCRGNGRGSESPGTTGPCRQCDVSKWDDVERMAQVDALRNWAA